MKRLLLAFIATVPPCPSDACRIMPKTKQSTQGKSSMARQRQQKSNRRARQPLLEKGFAALAVGVGMFVASFVLSGAGLMDVVARGLRTPAWFALGIGAVLIGLHVLINRVANKPVGSDQEAAIKPAMPKALREIFDDVAGRKSPFQRSPVPAQKPTQWSPTVFNAIEWRRFEAVCEALFAQAGFETRSQSHGPDGGVDVWLHSKNAVGPVSVAQCKHWRSKPVGVKEVREFFGVMASHQLKRGTYATTSTFTPDAIAFGKGNGIHLLDGAGLLRQIAQRTHEQQQALLAVAFEGDYARPTCASCGTKMVERTPAKGGSAFWGCANYPRCRSKMAMARIP
ncbi:MAG: restriction endonuclease [Hydrogenophaga sp.]|uniref:restriction endonuclease n=1 Tax=Hydrogenophaga sp. TaxID=1904254 RepID=UPI002733DC1A|nr:restriction endonuclease [Hydrogenophaga sp.]MDP3349608.1 restriction endonuclease [Hydrogenophaga sp.]